MSSAAILAAAFPALFIMGVLLAPLFSRGDRSRRHPQAARSRHKHLRRSRVGDPGAAFGRTESRLTEAVGVDDPPAKGDQYFSDWAALQARFNEEAAYARAASDDLITAAF